MYNYRLSQNHSGLLKYKKALGTATKTICNAKRSYERKLSLHIKDDPKAFYEYARSKTKIKDTVGRMTDDFGSAILDDGVNVKLLNEYFASIFTKENLVDIPMCNKVSYKNALNTVDFTEEIVYYELCKLRADKSPGVDGIYPVVLRNLANVIFKSLNNIFSQSLLCNIVPHDWKLANVTHLFKKGPKNMASNYRPVSLTYQVCKIMESILKDDIINHLEQNGFIRDSQHGFRVGRSCLTNLLYFMEIVTKQVDKGLPVDVVCLDFNKTLDKVPHNR